MYVYSLYIHSIVLYIKSNVDTMLLLKMKCAYLFDLSSICFRHSFNGVFTLGNIHNWHTRYFSNTTFQFTITSSNNVTASLCFKLSQS